MGWDGKQPPPGQHGHVGKAGTNSEAGARCCTRNFFCADELQTKEPLVSFAAQMTIAGNTRPISASSDLHRA